MPALDAWCRGAVWLVAPELVAEAVERDMRTHGLRESVRREHCVPNGIPLNRVSLCSREPQGVECSVCAFPRGFVTRLSLTGMLSLCSCEGSVPFYSVTVVQHAQSACFREAVVPLHLVNTGTLATDSFGGIWRAREPFGDSLFRKNHQ